MKRNQETPSTDPIQHPRSASVSLSRPCLQCSSWAVKSLGMIYASSSTTLAALSPQGFAVPGLAKWVARAYPPEKMKTWTGYTLSLLFWPPCLFLLGTSLYAWLTTGGAAPESALLYTTSGLIGVMAWSIPAFLRRKEADEHNLKIWEPAMDKWRTTQMCLKCGSV